MFIIDIDQHKLEPKKPEIFNTEVNDNPERLDVMVFVRTNGYGFSTKVDFSDFKKESVIYN